jgi:hypothetical protein
MNGHMETFSVIMIPQSKTDEIVTILDKAQARYVRSDQMIQFKDLFGTNVYIGVRAPDAAALDEITHKITEALRG